jgi:hypothetical protein
MVSLVLLGTGLCRAEEEFVEDFNRSNTDGPNGGISDDWEISGNIFVHDKHAITQTQGESVAVVKNVSLSKGFKAEVDFFGQVNDNFGGIVFNYASRGNFDVLRFQRWHGQGVAVPAIRGWKARGIGAGNDVSGGCPDQRVAALEGLLVGRRGGVCI